MYRASTGELGYYDEPPRRGGGERWDREKFDRMSNRRGGRDEHDHFHFEQHDRSGRGRRDVEFDERMDRKGPTVIERERFYDDRRESPRRPRSGFYDEPDPVELANRALAPYRRKSVVERDMDVAIRKPARPNYLRRVSSLDTFDRKPGPRFIEKERYVEKERDEWRPPTNVPIPLPIRERRRSPSRRRFREDDFEELSYRDLEPRDDFSEIEVIKRRSKSRTRRRAKSVSHSVRSSSTSSFEEVEAPKPVGKKGKTRMPKRLVKKQAIIELGYPFEEEEDFIIVRRALEKEQIDEIIKISENYKDERTTYVYEEKKELVAPPPPPPPHQPVVEELHIHHTHPAPPPSHYAQSVRSASPPRHHEHFEERIEQSNHIGGPLTVLVPPERRDQRVVHEERLDRDVHDEIRALEHERRLLKYEREREGDFEIIERREPRRDVVRIDRDRRGRLALVRSAH